MNYPKLTELYTSRDMIDAFGGYNHNLRIGDGEFYEMTNLTSSNYPVLSPRPKRGVYTAPRDERYSPTGIISKDKLCYVEHGVFYLNGEEVEGLSLNEMDKTLISMGAYVIIFPDKKYVNVVNPGEYGDIESMVTTTEDTTFTLCMQDGEEYVVDYTQSYEPDHPYDGDIWVDTSGSSDVLKKYSEQQEKWITIPTTYIRIASPGIGTDFLEGDSVTISGIGMPIVSALNTTLTIQARADDYIVVTGMLQAMQTEWRKITVERKIPKMDFIIESGNRLWGCRYGTANNGEIVNEIYASKLGDFKNWNSFDGISTDSYVATCGTDGAFSGAITHMGYPLFFKENCVHKVYGNFPSNFQIQTTACRGVQKGCNKSLAIVNETLYYKSRSAVCAYDGSLPVEISSALGEEAYSDAVAGSLGNKYYISMKDAKGKYHLFVYDTAKGMWHREDDTRAVEFCSHDGDLYYIDYADRKIKTVLGTGTKETANVRWSATSGIIGTDMPDKKYISRLVIRLALEIGTSITFSIEYDSSGEWEHLFSMAGTNLRSFSIPIRPRRCDHLRLRIDGVGDAKVFSICKTIEQGSDV